MSLLSLPENVTSNRNAVRMNRISTMLVVVTLSVGASSFNVNAAADNSQLKALDEAWCSRRELDREAQSERRASLDKWRHAHGYFRKQERDSYTFFPDEHLAKLSQSGDLLALDAQYQRLSKEGLSDKMPQAEALLLRAAANGSTQALLSLGNLAEVSTAGTIESLQGKQNALKFYLTAWRRGDFYGARKVDALVESLGERLTVEDVRKLEADSNELYFSLSEIRRELNLEPFDNSHSKSVLNKFSRDVAAASLSSRLDLFDLKEDLPSSPCVVSSIAALKKTH
ncbi:hypothetical protein R0137_06300 [Congregibacter brevis]|uniref:Uncharacterized protein n=1 Tax=Congregibacter brevis TaxID=3081201 RepID=A0ABZ0IGM2_9GAMM|nr:hypothetical protein R0137_06300 [Congregibacter sp. IMCC45268]